MLGVLFACAFGVGAFTADAAPAHAGFWRVAGSTCAGTTGIKTCPVADSSLGQENRVFTAVNVEVWDGSNSRQVTAKACLRSWDSNWFSCGPVAKSGGNDLYFTGHTTLRPERTWVDPVTGVAHSWTYHWELAHYAYVEVYAPDNLSLELKGIYYQW
jgi:hypothetical protein